MGNADDVIIVFNGQPFAGYLSFTADQGFDKAVGHAQVTVSAQPGRPFPVKVGTTAQILLGSILQPVITGHVKSVNGDDDLAKHQYQLEIMCKTRDAVESTIGPGNAFKPPVTLKQVMEKTLKNMGQSGIKVIDDASPEPYGSAEVPVGAIDQTGFDYFDQWTKKRGVVLGTDGKGNFKIQKNKKQRGPGMLFRSWEDNPRNNILSARYKQTDQDRFNKTSVASQHSQNDMDHWEGQDKGAAAAQPDKHANRYGVATDTGVRPERQKHIRGQKGMAGKTPKGAAKWRSNLARSRGFQYTARVQGFEMAPGVLWWPGFIIPVFDTHYDLSAELLIVDVKWTKDLNKGAITEVSLTYDDAFTDSEAGPKGSKTTKAGAGSTDSGEYGEADSSDVDDNDPGGV